jgi:hypothetical protein
MIERGQRLRLALEAHQAIVVGGDGGRQDLDRDAAVERVIARARDLARRGSAEPEGSALHLA